MIMVFSSDNVEEQDRADKAAFLDDHTPVKVYTVGGTQVGLEGVTAGTGEA